MFDTKILEKIKPHMFSYFYLCPPPENRAIYEILWKNVVEPDMP